MPFGLSNASANFEGIISKILAKKLNIFVIFYSDKHFIHIKNADQPQVNGV